MEDDVVVWGRRFNDGVPFWTFYSIWERGVVQPGTDPNPVLNPDDNSGYQTEVVPHLSVCPSPATAAQRAADKIASLPTGDDWEWGGGIVAANKVPDQRRAVDYTGGSGNRRGYGSKHRLSEPSRIDP